MNKTLYAIRAAGIFLAIQLLGSAIMGLALSFCHKLNLNVSITTCLSIVLLLSNLVAAFLFHRMKFYNIKKALSASSFEFPRSLAVIFYVFCGVFALQILNEFVDLPNLMEQEFTDMSTNPIGLFAMCIAGPVVEELVFRQAIISECQKLGFTTWKAIAISALCFGIIHLNPAQVPFAAAIGILLAMVYIKSGNVFITSIIHIINNSICGISLLLLGEKANEFKYIDYFGSTSSFILMVVFGTLCICCMRKWWMSK